MYNSIPNMALMSFLVGFSGMAIFQKKLHKTKQILSNRIISGCIVSSTCVIIHTLLKHYL